jgi:hypothetical protein
MSREPHVSELGVRLYEIVEEYAAIGAHHRTGTGEDVRTLDWFEDRVRALGATTERQPWSFDRYDAECSFAIRRSRRAESFARADRFGTSRGPGRRRARGAAEGGVGTRSGLRADRQRPDEQRHRARRCRCRSRPTPADHAAFGMVSLRGRARHRHRGDARRRRTARCRGCPAKIRAWLPGASAALAAVFAPLGKTPVVIPDAERARPESWVGEARAWCTLDRPLISIAGGFPLFHTPEDVAVEAARLVARSA